MSSKQIIIWKLWLLLSLNLDLKQLSSNSCPFFVPAAPLLPRCRGNLYVHDYNKFPVIIILSYQIPGLLPVRISNFDFLLRYVSSSPPHLRHFLVGYFYLQQDTEKNSKSIILHHDKVY